MPAAVAGRALGADRHRLCPSRRQGERCGFVLRQMNGFHCLTNTHESASQCGFGRRADTCQLWFIAGEKQPALRRRMTRARCCAGFVLGRMCGNRRSSKCLGPLHHGGLCQLAGKFLTGFTLFRASQATAWSRGGNRAAWGL